MRTPWVVQLRMKSEEENLAEWLVDITSEAERQGSDKFVVGYNKSVPHPSNPLSSTQAIAQWRDLAELGSRRQECNLRATGYHSIPECRSWN